MEGVKGTTTVGIKGKDFVVLAADKQASYPTGLVVSVEVEKVLIIDDHLAITTAGTVGDLQLLARVLEAHAKWYYLENKRKISPKAAATYLATILNVNRIFPYLVEFLIGGYLEKPYLASVDMVGGIEEAEKFTASGSGSPIALGVLEDQYSKDISEEEAIELAKRAILSARKRDVWTGGETIDVVVVDSKGARKVR